MTPRFGFSSFLALTDTSRISGTSITNIICNGHAVTYDSAACPALGGAAYSIVNGGTLIPE